VTPLRGRARDLWARTTVRVWPGPCVLASLPRERAGEVAGALAEAGGFVAFVVERDEVSLTLPEAEWRDHPLRPLARAESGPWRVLTFDLELPLDVTGYLAPAAAALAAAAVPIVPQCAFSKDHLLVPEEKLAEAVRALDALIEDARHAEAG
jgi:uncharacterized protein